MNAIKLEKIPISRSDVLYLQQRRQASELEMLIVSSRSFSF